MVENCSASCRAFRFNGAPQSHFIVARNMTRADRSPATASGDAVIGESVAPHSGQPCEDDRRDQSEQMMARRHLHCPFLPADGPDLHRDQTNALRIVRRPDAQGTIHLLLRVGSSASLLPAVGQCRQPPPIGMRLMARDRRPIGHARASFRRGALSSPGGMPSAFLTRRSSSSLRGTNRSRQPTRPGGLASRFSVSCGEHEHRLLNDRQAQLPRTATIRKVVPKRVSRTGPWPPHQGHPRTSRALPESVRLRDGCNSGRLAGFLRSEVRERSTSGRSQPLPCRPPRDQLIARQDPGRSHKQSPEQADSVK